MNASQGAPDINGLTETLTDFLVGNGGTVAQLYGLDKQELEAAYGLAYKHYNQARWTDALQAFSFLCLQNHLDRRFHIGRAACLQMLKRHEEALHFYGIAHVMDMTDPAVGFHIAECLIALGRRDDALVALEAVVAAAEEDARNVEITKRAEAVTTLLKAQKESA